MGGWTPALWFLASEQGAWYDPSDMSTLFQDDAGTTPVTAVGQPVGKMLDKSGRGNHATQANASNKPILQSIGGKLALVFDGVDDFLSTASIDFTATDKMTEVLGISVNSGTFGVIHELSASLASNTGAFARLSGVVSSRHYPTVIRGSAAVNGYAGMASSTQPDLCVLSATHDIAGDLTRARRNGVYGGDETTDKGTGNLGNYPLYIGRRGGTSSSAKMDLYQFVLRGAATTTPDLETGETFTAGKTGITL